jgi:hypothetical protein
LAKWKYGVHKPIAGDAGFSANALANLHAQPQPRDWPVFGKPTDLGGVAHVGQSIQFFVILRVSAAYQSNRGTELECPEVDDAEAEGAGWKSSAHAVLL